MTNASRVPDVLAVICDDTRDRIADRMKDRPIEALKETIAASSDKPRGFSDAVSGKVDCGKVGLIAEIKKASPSAGMIRPDFSPAKLAQAYEAAGAACLSVLTEESRFLGHTDYVVEARNACALPVLRKDFMVDPWQVWEARAIGADAILLILAAIPDTLAVEMESLAFELGMDVLVEVHDEPELKRALNALKTPLLGINNRNLKTLVTDIANTEHLAPMVPDDRVIVCESGLKSAQDIARMRAVGAHRFLIGEHFMRQPDVEQAVRDMIA